jgi:methylated-DNA-[protein]-cysteine S-methyltransferase
VIGDNPPMDPGPMELRLSRFDSPIGRLLIVSDQDARLHLLDFGNDVARLLRLLERAARYAGGAARARQWHALTPTILAVAGATPMARTQVSDIEADPPPRKIADALARYFDGDLAAIDRLETAPAGPPFMRQVWSALRDLLPGERATYARIAAKLGQPAATRAVGLANGANPIAVVVPCHRLVGSDGSLTGYGGGLARKRWLLAHEERLWTRAAARHEKAPATRASILDSPPEYC